MVIMSSLKVIIDLPETELKPLAHGNHFLILNT